MNYQTILYSVSDGVARLTLNRPERLNSFNAQMHAEVRQALARLESDSTVRVLVITGAGRGFCAGQDLSDRTVAPGGEAVDLGASIERDYKPLILTLRRLPVPVLCAVNGVAAGAGANIALACDLVLAAHSASFVQAFARIGLAPDSGGTWFLPRLVGPARALGLALLGEKLLAREAAEWGLIWRCIDDDDFAAEVDSLAARLAAAPTLALRRIRQALADSWSHTLEQQLDVERDVQRELGFSADYAEGVAAFIAKREPRFIGR
ncbi:MAG: 2-(1,2-epoxy-1,2-dihydrophenyl)acetyl-CoA isomerase PaaG [Steroidobacteraceae bacterium]